MQRRLHDGRHLRPHPRGRHWRRRGAGLLWRHHCVRQTRHVLQVGMQPRQHELYTRMRHSTRQEQCAVSYVWIHFREEASDSCTWIQSQNTQMRFFYLKRLGKIRGSSTKIPSFVHISAQLFWRTLVYCHNKEDMLVACFAHREPVNYIRCLTCEGSKLGHWVWVSFVCVVQQS